MVRPIRTLGPLLGVLLTLGFVGRASATPGDTLGFGTRNINLAGAVTADVEDVGGNYYNPAGIVRGPGLRLTLSYVSMNSALEINGRDSNVERMSGITLARALQRTPGA